MYYDTLVINNYKIDFNINTNIKISCYSVMQKYNLYI